MALNFKLSSILILQCHPQVYSIGWLTTEKSCMHIDCNLNVVLWRFWSYYSLKCVVKELDMNLYWYQQYDKQCNETSIIKREFIFFQEMATPIYLAYQLLSLVPWNNYFLLCCLCYFLLYLYVFFDPLLHRPMTIWNLFVLYDKEAKCV